MVKIAQNVLMAPARSAVKVSLLAVMVIVRLAQMCTVMDAQSVLPWDAPKLIQLMLLWDLILVFAHLCLVKIVSHALLKDALHAKTVILLLMVSAGLAVLLLVIASLVSAHPKVATRTAALKVTTTSTAIVTSVPQLSVRDVLLAIVKSA